MTVESSTAKAGPFTGNAVTIAFPFDFRVFNTDEVTVILLALATGVETELTLDSDYSISLNADQDADPGGTITYPLTGSPMDSGHTLTAVSALDYTQETDIPENGAFFASVVEAALDRATLLIQQVLALQNASLRFPASDPALGVELPPAAQRAGTFLTFDPNGSVLVGTTVEGAVVSAAMVPVLEAISLSAARTALGSGAVGDALFTATTQTIARAALGLGTAALLNAGTGVGNLVQMAAGPKLPAVDGSALTNIPNNRLKITRRHTVAFGPQTGTPSVPDLIPQSQIGNLLAAGVTLKGTTAPFMVTSANGFNADGSANDTIALISADVQVPNLTGSSTNYIWYDPVAGTAGFTTVADATQNGGVIPTTNNQHTFDWSPNGKKMYLGNGSAAVQSNHVIVAEVDTSSTAVTAIRVRAYNREFISDLITYSSAALSNQKHNIGPWPMNVMLSLVNQTSEFGYSVGDEEFYWSNLETGNHTIGTGNSKNNLRIQMGSLSVGVTDASGLAQNATFANWKLRAYVEAKK